MPEPAPRPTGSRAPTPAVALWLLGSYLLLVPPFLRWLQVPASARLSLPHSPVDRTLWRYAEEWIFLEKARAWVPPGATVTVAAVEPRREVSLYILSLGLLVESRPLPGRYFDAPSQVPRRPAEFVLAFRCASPEGGGPLRRVAAFEEGCVFRQTGSP